MQHARLPCPSPSPGDYSNSCPLSRWYHPIILSSVVPLYILWKYIKERENNKGRWMSGQLSFVFDLRELFNKLDDSVQNLEKCFCSIVQSYLTLCKPMDCSMPGFPVLHRLLELAQTHVHRVGDAIQPSHPLSSPSPPALKLPQHQDLPMSQLFTAGGQSIGASASASVLPVNIQDWFPSSTGLKNRKAPPEAARSGSGLGFVSSASYFTFWRFPLA